MNDSPGEASGTLTQCGELHQHQKLRGRAGARRARGVCLGRDETEESVLEPGNENDADDPSPPSLSPASADSSNARHCAGDNDVLLLRNESTRLLAM